MIRVEDHPEGCVLSVRTKPGARKAGVLGEQGGALKVVVTAPPVSLATTRCRSAKAATWGRWVTTRTWWLRASRASRRPISTAA